MVAIKKLWKLGLPVLAVVAFTVGCEAEPTEVPTRTAASPMPTVPTPTQTGPVPTQERSTASPPPATETPPHVSTASPGLTVEPTATRPVATPPSTLIPVNAFTVPPDRDLFELARSLLKITGPIPRVVNYNLVSYAEGREDTFWLIDIQGIRTYTSQAKLRLVSPHAYWYVEKGLNVSQDDLKDAAQAFETRIYPEVTAAFGTEWTPGVDNDPHFTILNARLRGVSGYFSSTDQYPTILHPHSNQREMLYMNSSALRVGSRSYLATLAHELQHAVHRNGDATEDTWVNEGLSELASLVVGYRPWSNGFFLRSPTTSLVHWPVTRPSVVNYGAASMFFEYLSSHYGGSQNMALLVQESTDGIQGISAYLARMGYDATFHDVFADWVVANFLDEPGNGRYSYPNSQVKVHVSNRIRESEEKRSSIPQFSAEYTAIDTIEGDVIVRFRGQKENKLLPLDVNNGGCWWSNRGDAISSTLTRSLDLSGVDSAALTYRIWYDVEEDWDYGYVQVSSDGGSTWDIIAAPGTSPRNPVGNSFGNGYTGTSGGWMREEVDLTPFAGRQVVLRFHYVTDESTNGAGLCFDDIAIPEIGFSDEAAGHGGWQANGFVRIDNRVPQDYIVQVIEVGEENRVRRMELDEDNRGELAIRGLENLDDAVVVVAALAPHTLQEASYTLALEPAP